ncbi:DUF3710 domain-containing protein [Williamsia sp. SKLECPSW1]
MTDATHGGPQIGSGAGPYDIEELDAELGLDNSHLDLGSVLVPVVEGGQVTVEMTADHQPQAVYLVTPHGRISVAAFAAPRSPGLWAEVVGELVESLRADGATATTEAGYWGREVVGTVEGAVHRFIGVDGPRWMVRCVASAAPETADDLTLVARAVLSETVVRRGGDPFPPREPLPVLLPPVLAEQVAAAQQQMADQGAFAENGMIAPQDPDADVSAPDPSDPQSGTVEGAPAQIARAQVVSEDGLPVAEVDGDSDPAAEGDAPTPQGKKRSSGSALQRLRRRQGR